MIVKAVCTVVTVAMGYLLTPLLLAPMMAALYWLASLADRKTTRCYGIATMAALMIAAVISDSMEHLSLLLRTIGPFFWLLLPLAAGNMTRLRRAYLEAVQARAEHAERTREEEARLRVTEERMRIARELHDVVAHHLALANAQAGTAAHLALVHPAQSQKILTDLTATTSSALRELKATLGLLRQNDDPASPSLEPAPGLARLPELVSACESAGLTVKVTTEGEPQQLSPGRGPDGVPDRAGGADQRHQARRRRARPCAARLRPLPAADHGHQRRPRRLGRSRARPAVGPGQGFGVMGMRERAHSIGGELRAGPRPEGGFEVATALPLQPSTARPSTARPSGVQVAVGAPHVPAVTEGETP